MMFETLRLERSMSNVSISEENSVSSGRLGDGITAKEQKAAKTIAFDLQMTASSSGLLLRNSDPSPPPHTLLVDPLRDLAM